jgi:hypothetical protein
MPHEERTCISSFPVIDECGDIVYSHPGCGDIDAFPVFYDLQGIRGAAFGMTWPEEWGTCSFTICDSEHSTGELVNPGDGVYLVWDTCQQRTFITLGFGWLVADSPGRICIVPEPLEGKLGVLGCNADMEPPVATCCAGVCGESGDDPCEPGHTVPTTWGGIKAMFR